MYWIIEQFCRVNLIEVGLTTLCVWLVLRKTNEQQLEILYEDLTQEEQDMEIKGFQGGDSNG
jgi:hypothetical protein